MYPYETSVNDDQCNAAPYHTGGIPDPTMTIVYDYEMKSWPAFYAKMLTGEKKHDMRKKADRSYAVGDKVLLREYDPFGGGYTGRQAVFRITYITSDDTPCALSSNALSQDHCILSMELVPQVVSSFTYLCGVSDVKFDSASDIIRKQMRGAIAAAKKDGRL